MATAAERQDELPQLNAQFAKTLGLADDVSFLRMLWALHALQTGRAEAATPYLNSYPAEAATEGILGQHAIFPWEIETLTNELLTNPKNPYYRLFDCRSWNTIGGLITSLRALENAEYGARRDASNIHVELGRIAARQFPWQRGYFGVPQLYRNAFIYGQGQCADYLLRDAGLTASDMTLVGFSLLSMFYPEPSIRPTDDLQLIHEWGISPEILQRTLGRIARPLSELRDQALRLRDVDVVTAYKPSILRQFPCLLVGRRARIMIAPLPDLIMDRVTNGLFYDVVAGGGPIRDEIGQRFETYSLSLLREMLTNTQFLPEASYRTRLGQVATPDILMLDNEGAVQLAIECKASRMSVTARFGEGPEQDRGYEEIAKGVMQLWRFIAHCRANISTNRLAVGCQCMILTMDEWFAGRSTVIPLIIQRANEIADASAHHIPQQDRIPASFCTISELEAVLSTATAASLREAVRIGSNDRQGWIFSILHQEAKAPKTDPKAYPFEEELGRLLPWYARVAELRDDGEGI